MKILYVEDEPLLAETLAETLVEFGYEVVLAEDGNKAKTLIESTNDFDVLITDANLPGLKGPAIAQLFNKKFPNNPICLASGHLDAEELYKSDLGTLSVYFLNKPFSQMDLVK